MHFKSDVWLLLYHQWEKLSLPRSHPALIMSCSNPLLKAILRMKESWCIKQLKSKKEHVENHRLISNRVIESEESCFFFSLQKGVTGDRLLLASVIWPPDWTDGGMTRVRRAQVTNVQAWLLTNSHHTHTGIFSSLSYRSFYRQKISNKYASKRPIVLCKRLCNI